MKRCEIRIVLEDIVERFGMLRVAKECRDIFQPKQKDADKDKEEDTDCDLFTPSLTSRCKVQKKLKFFVCKKGAPLNYLQCVDRQHI